MHDAAFPDSPDEAGVYNLFQLVTATLANRAREDKDFHQAARSDSASGAAPSPSAGIVTKMIGIAINDCEAGRISKRDLLEIFQAAIDNGDILEPDNEYHVVAHVVPLLDEGVLHPSPHLVTFMSRMDAKASAFAADLRNRANKDKPWWNFWS